jgi:putative ABC transport system permease protein
MRVARVVGVIEDVRWTSAEYPVNPLFLRATDHGPFYSVKLREGADPQAALDHLQRAYTTVFAGNAFEYFFADDAFQALYDEERRFASLLGLFAGLALIVALLGVLGLAAHTASARLQEMSIRRVLGARMADVVRLLVRDFAWLSSIALLIGLPLTYWAASTWLAHFATRITLGPTLFAGPGFAVLCVVMLVAGGYALKAAWVDPATHLRRE